MSRSAKPNRPPNRPGGRGPKGRRKRPDAKAPSLTVQVTIDKLGAQGDGMATASLLSRPQTLYLAGALPGEVVLAQTVSKRGDGLVAELLEVQQASPQRKEPGCPHFADCGGCALQHLEINAYAAFKRDRVVQALVQRGFQNPPVTEPVLTGEGTRRRVIFTVQKRGKRVLFGYNARASHDIVAVDRCPLLVDSLNALIEPLSQALVAILNDGGRTRVHVTACENGADVMIEGTASPGLSAREALATFVQTTDAVRVSWKEEGLNPEPITQETPPLIYLSGVPVELSPGAFLQASVEGEHAIRDAVLAGVGSNARRVADLYCGLGSFSIPLAQQAIVHAVDATEAPVRALERAAGRAGLGGWVKAQVRDLDRQPIDEKELATFDAVVFDPPRSGAAEQVSILAGADVAR